MPSVPTRAPIDYDDLRRPYNLVRATSGVVLALAVTVWVTTSGDVAAILLALPALVVVADAWQGRGIATELMRSLGAAAWDRGIRTLEGSTLAENQRIHNWARRLGLDARTEPNSGGQVKVTLELASMLS